MKHKDALEAGRRLLELLRETGVCPVLKCCGNGVHELGLLGHDVIVAAAYAALDDRTRFAMILAAHHEWPDPNRCCCRDGMTRQ